MGRVDSLPLQLAAKRTLVDLLGTQASLFQRQLP